MKPKRPKTRKARLDADKTAKPRTVLVAHVPPGVAPWPHLVERYELKDVGEPCDHDPRDKHEGRCPHCP